MKLTMHVILVFMYLVSQIYHVSGGESEVFSSRFFSANLLTDLFSRQLLLVIICDMGVLKTVTQSSGRKYFQCTLKVLPDLL